VEFIIREDRNICIISAIGHIDASTAEQLEEKIVSKVNDGLNNLVIDLSQVEFMSSAGLRAILAGLKETRQAGGDLRLAAAQPGVEKVLQISGFTSVIKLYREINEAVTSFL
jgi:anti-sigma B factor antagonist